MRQMETDPESADLIEKLLAEDDPYRFEEHDDAEVEGDDDSDYVETPARKKQRKCFA